MLPAALSGWDVLLLVLTSGVTSLLTAVAGIGGGVLLLAVMAQSVPVAALIPVHGLVQLGSNGNRAVMTRAHADWRIIRLFCFGALIGALLAGFLVVQLPLEVITLSVGGFILYSVWGPKPKQVQLPRPWLVLVGAATTLVSAFVGATGPLVAAFVHRQGLDKMGTVATFAACMSFQHLLKVVVFLWVGFVFTEWLGLALLMIASGFLGTWIGVKWLKNLPDVWFKRLFRVVVTLLALRLIGSVVVTWF